MNEKKDGLDDLMKANPQAAAERGKVEKAIEAVRRRRDVGLGPKEYELTTPFGHRSWLRQVRA